MTTPQGEFTLRRKGDQVVLCCADGSDGVPVRLIRTRPVTGRGGAVSILDTKTKKELLLLRDFKRLDSASQSLLEEELGARYFLPKIKRVLRTDAHFGNRYWHVETDCGRRQFLMKSPDTNILWTTEDHCVLQDAMGNCYEIESLQALDRASRKEIDKVI